MQYRGWCMVELMRTVNDTKCKAVDTSAFDERKVASAKEKD
jgi:hypothetical protein